MEVSLNNNNSSYQRIDRYDPAKLAEIALHYEKILSLLGEDPTAKDLSKRLTGLPKPCSSCFRDMK